MALIKNKRCFSLIYVNIKLNVMYKMELTETFDIESFNK